MPPSPNPTDSSPAAPPAAAPVPGQAKKLAPSDLVAIKHKDVKAEGVCTKRQFDDLWSKKGWELSDTSPADVAAAAVESLSAVTETPEV